MPYQKHHTTREAYEQTVGDQDDWSKQVLPRLPANLEEQAMKLKAVERSRKISRASDLLRGLLAYVYTAHSFEHLSIWSVLLGVADVSANNWRKRLQKASQWLEWLLQEVLASSSAVSAWLGRAGRGQTHLVDRWDPLEVPGSSRHCLACAYRLRFVGRSAHADQSDGLP